MRLLLAVLATCFLIVPVSAQDVPDTAFAVDYKLDGRTLYFYNSGGSVVERKEFTDPRVSYSDLNADSTEEFIVVDNAGTEQNPQYFVYVYALDSLIFMIDSLPSGRFEPYLEFNDSLDAEVIAVGASATESFFFAAGQDTVVFPVLFYTYDGEELVSAAEELYDFYLSENDRLLSLLAKKGKSTDCEATQRMRSVILSVYWNYRHANELSLADQFFRQYYHCGDSMMVKSYIDMF